MSNSSSFARLNYLVDDGSEGGGGGCGDYTPPLTPQVLDDGIYTNKPHQLHARWSSSDPESGIAEYKCGVGTSPGLVNVVNWTSVGLTNEATGSGLNLIDGQSYYVTVIAKNGCGLWSTAGNSDGIIVDTTPPVITTVMDDGEFTYNRTQLHAIWQSLDEDGTPVDEYQYAVGTVQGESGNDIVDWISVGNSTEVTKTNISLSIGQTYYFNLKAKNAANLWSQVAFSNGITVLNQIPQIISLIPQNNSKFNEGDIINIEVQAQDPDGDALEYRYLVDGQVKQDWILTNTYSWQTQIGEVKLKTITVEVRDNYSATTSQGTNVFLYRKAIAP